MRLLAHLLGVFAVCSANPLLSLFSTQTPFGKRLLVAVASALVGVALLPFK